MAGRGQRRSVLDAAYAAPGASDASTGRSRPARASVVLGEQSARYLLGLVALVALYYGSAHLGYALEFAGPIGAIIWLPVGVAIAFLYLGGLRYWPGVLIGDLLVNNYSALPLGSALGQSAGNLLEVLVATALIRRFVRRGTPLGTVGNLTHTILAIALGTAVSATIGTLSLRLGDVVSTAAAARVWRTWWLGDWSGALVVVPLAIAWYRPLDRQWWRGRETEAAAAVAAVAGLSALALQSHQPLTYLVFPGLLWAAVRFGQRGATLAIAIVAGFTVWATTHYGGPFTVHFLTHAVLSTQLFIGVVALSTLCLAAVVSEREELAERLTSSRATLVEAADAERRRLERDLHDGAQQRLTALAVRLGLASDRVRQEPELVPALIGEAEAELMVAIDELRELAHGIHPTALTRLGLTRSMERVAAHSAVPIKLLALPSARVDPATEATAYYVFAEALTNAQRHSHASTIHVRAFLAHHVLHVEVADDGIGGAVESPGSGLQGLRDRVEAVGGSFAVESDPDHGTRIEAAIPVSRRSR